MVVIKEIENTDLREFMKEVVHYFREYNPAGYDTFLDICEKRGDKYYAKISRLSSCD